MSGANKVTMCVREASAQLSVQSTYTDFLLARLFLSKGLPDKKMSKMQGASVR